MLPGGTCQAACHLEGSPSSWRCHGYGPGWLTGKPNSMAEIRGHGSEDATKSEVSQAPYPKQLLFSCLCRHTGLSLTERKLI